MEKDIVEGVIYELTEEEIKKLDAYEGYQPNATEHPHYQRKTIQLADKTKVITYIAYNQLRETLSPCQDYLAHLLKAKGLLSDSYYQQLNQTPSLLTSIPAKTPKRADDPAGYLLYCFKEGKQIGALGVLRNQEAALTQEMVDIFQRPGYAEANPKTVTALQSYIDAFNQEKKKEPALKRQRKH